jgi:diaminopimelate decarboxylase
VPLPSGYDLLPVPDLPLDRDLLLDAAARFGTPTYVYAEAVVRAQAARLRALTAGLPADLLYALKANSCPALLAVLKDEGFGLDAVSPGELLLTQRLGFAPEAILFSPNMMADAEMDVAVEAGVLLNVGELSSLDRFGATHPGAEVCVRLNPGTGAGHHAHVVTAGDRTKFGVPLAHVEQVLEIAARHRLRVVGLHQHIGSGILDPARFRAPIEALLGVAERFPDVRFLNVGGGLGVPYRPGEAALDETGFRNSVVSPLATWFDAHPGVRVRFEPGRFLVAAAGVLLTRVTAVKESGARAFAGTDSGMNHLARPSVYGAYHHVVNLSSLDVPARVYTVTGNICETGDVFAEDRTMPETREGDVLALLDAGAYGMAMASTYNLRPLPAEVFVDAAGGARLVRPRQTAESLVAALLDPC